jgi:SPP1 gp7 family putative phage head morphogenesis protein
MPNLYDNQFWLEEEDSLWEDLAEVIIGALLAGVAGGAALLPTNAQALVDFDLVNTSVIDYAKQYRYDLIKGITDTTRQQTQKLVSDWVLSGQPLPVLEAQLAPIFGDVRAGMIAATESTRVFAEGNRAAFESTGMVEEVEIQTSEDERVCEICGPLSGTRVDVDDTAGFPPFHVNCRCWTHPILSDEAFANRLDEILA